MNFKKIFCKITAVLLVICISFSGCSDKMSDTPTSTVPFSTEASTKKEDDKETRKNYGVGSCYNMKSSICYYLIFLDDKESSWSEKDKKRFISDKFEPSLNFLHEKAKNYDVVLDDKYKVHDSKIMYSSIVDADVVTNGSQDEILPALAKSMGYASVRSMNINLRIDLDVQQVAYLVVLNKKGRSYKHSYTLNSLEKYEYCVFFNDTIIFENGNCTSTIAHEILHLFGAEDYYDPYGNYPEREKLAKKLYPNDIMNETFKNINDAEIGKFTAYTVGWLDTMPEECNVPEWWK